GELSRSSGGKFVDSVDIKAQHPFYYDFFNSTQAISPLFDLKASSDPTQDTDSLRTWVEWDWVLGSRRVGPLQQLDLRNSAYVESDRHFKDTNFLWGSKLVLLSIAPESKDRVVQTYIRPYFGFEIGKNLKSPVPLGGEDVVARGLIGLTQVVSFRIKQPGIKEIDIETTYERRMLMRKETSFVELPDKTLQAVSFGRTPKDWVDSKLTFKFTDFFGATVEYQFGQKPPTYNLVNHTLKIGLLFRAKFKSS
ncbi:MAG: hypothetical protein ACREAC_16200, partial [Blastocatellia bacterium]